MSILAERIISFTFNVIEDLIKNSHKKKGAGYRGIESVGFDVISRPPGDSTEFWH